jgi:hypothetical protein
MSLVARSGIEVYMKIERDSYMRIYKYTYPYSAGITAFHPARPQKEEFGLAVGRLLLGSIYRS